MTSQDEHTVLPPLVCGKLHGHLTMKVDEVVWCRKCPGEVFVETKWWGDQQSVKFKPSNILKPSIPPEEDTVKIFDVKTSLTLFEIYLRNCEQLELTVFNEDTNEIIGRVCIKCLYQITTDFQYQSYFPIINSFGNRIGDLHVGFILWMKQQKSAISGEFKNVAYSTNTKSMLSKDQDRVKKKKGCNVCISENTDKLQQSRSVLPCVVSVPPNTELSNYSDTVISEILIKGQQLRDAMVMSVLEDCDVLHAEKDINTCCSDFSRQQKPFLDGLSSQKSSQDSSTKDQEAVVDYLLGKQMTEEEEAKALETLRTTSPAHSLVDLVEFHNEDSLEEESRSQIEEASVNDYQKQRLTDRSAFESEDETQWNVVTERAPPLPPEYNKVNCFRFTVKKLSLTPLGLRKVNPPQNRKSRFIAGEETIVCPVTTYFIECHMDQNSVSQTQAWKVRPERFCSRRQIDNIVYFGQSSVYLVPSPFTLTALNTVLKSLTWLVCWKQLNQRTPSLLGAINLESRSQVHSLETVWSLPVETADGTYGFVEMLFELGHDKKQFGNMLLEEQTVVKNTKVENIALPLPNITQGKDQNMYKKKQKHFTELELIQKKGENKPTDGSDVQYIQSNRSENLVSEQNHQNMYKKKQKHFTELETIQKKSENKTTNVSNTKYIPSNRSESLVLEQNYCCIICRSQIRNTAQSVSIPTHPSLCVQCQVPGFTRTSSLLTHKANSVTHEFLVRIDGVRDFPLFLNSGHDVKCYIDYKFLGVDLFGKACMGHDTVTSRVMSCNEQVHFASDHFHRLNLPTTTPLSSCLLSYKPGVTFHVWLRYFKPSPRDHMVAMAHLPTSKLCSLELQFLSNQMERPVIEMLELPLILVSSSITAPYQQHQQNGFGMIQISVSYRQLISSESKYLNFEVKQEETVKPLSLYDQDIGCNRLVEEKENRDTNYILEEVKLKDTEKCKATQNKLTQTVSDHFVVEKDEIEEQNFNFMRRRFWTGEVKDKPAQNYKSVMKDNQIIGKNKVVRKPFDRNKEEYNLYLNSQVNSSLQKQTEMSRLQLGNEFSDSGVYSSSIKENIPLAADYAMSVETENHLKQENDFERLVFDEIDEKDLTFYSLKSDLSSLSVIDEYPSTCETKWTENLEELEGGIDSLEKNNIVSVKESSDQQDCVTGLSEKNYSLMNEGNNPMHTDYLKDEISQKDKKSVTLSEEGTIEGLIENTEFEHENLVSNETIHNSKDDLVENNKNKLFKARVEIEQALHLPMLTKSVDGEVRSVAPSVCVAFKCGSLGSPQTVTTEVARQNCNPVWKHCCDVELDVELLEQVDKRLVFSVLEEDVGGDFVFGYATADLNVLPLGLSCLCSWLNITDLELTCKGQIKVNITPLEDVSQSKTKLVANLATAEVNKNKEIDDCVYIAQGQFNTFPSFIASQTQVHIMRIPSDTRPSETIASDIKEKITEMEEFISGLKHKMQSLSVSDGSQSQINPSEEDTDESKVCIDLNIPENEVFNNRSENKNKRISEEENKKSKEGKGNIQEEAGNPCASVCRGCHHCVCRHDDNLQGTEYFINPLVLQRFLTSLSEIQVNLPNNRDYKQQKAKSMTLHKSTSCPQLEESLILDQNISEFEEFLQGKSTGRVLKETEVCKTADLSSNATRASEISSDDSEGPVIDYCSLRETPEGGNPAIDVKSRNKLERQTTFVIDK